MRHCNEYPKKMRQTIFLIGISLTLAFTACTPGKKLSQINTTAEAAYQAGNYAAALQSWEQVIQSHELAATTRECPVYGRAGQAALQLGQTRKAISYLEKDQYSVAVNATTYQNLATAYREIDNLSKEMDALETYVKKYPAGEDYRQVQKRLFETYVESERWDRVLEYWAGLPDESKEDPQLLEGFFTANKSLKNEDACDEIARTLLQNDAENMLALDYWGKKYYYKAEDRYRTEMMAYENKKTNKQYRILLSALDEVTADFKKSLGYFKTLYKLDPSPVHAKYLGYIYGRLDDKKKEKYYKNLAGE